MPEEDLNKEMPEQEEVKARLESDVLADILSRDESDLIPWEPVILPSKGLYYNGKIPGGKIEVRAWGLSTDKILATSRLSQSGRSLDMVYKKCVRFPDSMDPLDLLVGDRVFLLYYLRGITHGNIYEFLVQCSNDDCENTWTVDYDLNELAKTITWANEELGEEPFKVVLPYLSKVAGQEFWVKVRLMRGRDLTSMMTRRRLKKNVRPSARNRSRSNRPSRSMSEDEIDKTVEENLNLIIVEAMKDKNPHTINKLVSKMHAKDTATVREFLRENSPGIDTSIEVVCPECNNVMTIDLPITESFFRPTGS